jgi:hypothetical protein
MDPADGMTGTSVNIQNKVQCLGAVMKPCDCNLRDSQLRQVMDDFPNIAGFTGIQQQSHCSHFRW